MKYNILFILVFSVLLMAKTNSNIPLRLSTKNNVLKNCTVPKMYYSIKTLTLDYKKIFKCKKAFLDFNLYDKNIIFLRKLEEIAIELYGDDSYQVNIITLQIALSYLSSGEIDKAKRIFASINEIKENKPYENNLLLITQLLNAKADYAYLLNDLNTSKKYLIKSIRIQENNKSINTINYFSTLNRIALLETDTHNYNKALNYMRKIEKIVNENNISMNNSERVEILISIGNIYEKKGDFNSSKDAYLSALKLKAKEYDPQVIQILSYLGNILFLSGEREKAKIIIEELLRIKSLIQYPNNIYIANAYLVLANYYQTKNFTKEQENLEKVKNILNSIKIPNMDKKLLNESINNRLQKIEKEKKSQ